jgi:hypothetical protein
MRTSLLIPGLCLFAACAAGPHDDPVNTRAATGAASVDPQETCRRIAADIQGLQGRFPQLEGFRADQHHQGGKIRYEHRCQPPTGRGGWTGAVPEPGPDGVWFYISLWDPSDAAEANAQINTQPVIPEWHIGTQRVTFLIREGERAPKLAGAIMGILERNGMR